MRLFISYSRDDKAWVHNFWWALQEYTNYDIWLDRRLVPASDWWDSILDNIERCDCLVTVLTPKSVESIYCTAELDYALALNKPILPLVLKHCDYPSKLDEKRIQYEFIGDMPMDRVLLRATLALGELQAEVIRGAYPLHYNISRPDVPEPKAQESHHVFEVFAVAEEAAAHGNTSLALGLFHQVALADPTGLGLAASQRMVEVRLDYDREFAYSQVLRLTSDPATRRGAEVAWQAFTRKYGTDYDPNGLAEFFASYTPKSPVDTGTLRAVKLPPDTPPQQSNGYTLPQPFAWCEIPSGYVTLAEGGYVPESGNTFHIEPFRIAKYPVTVEQYALFVQAGGYNNPNFWTKDGWNWRMVKNIDYPRFWNEPHWHRLNHPIVGVSWFEAFAYCNWLSSLSGERITLPTEQQWQRAAQGDDQRLYPWGNTMDENRCNFTSSTGHTTPVNQYPKGASPYGVIDMSGNVWEWCLTDGITGSQNINGTNSRILRGGAWDYRQLVATTTVRLSYFPSFRYTLVGFRLVCIG